MEKEVYVSPEMQVIMVEKEDIIRTSDIPDTPFVPANSGQQ